MFHPTYTYINKTVTDFTARPILQDIFVDGELVYELPTLEEIKEYSLKHRNALWDEYVRILNPEDYPVDLSQKAWDHKMNTIQLLKQTVQKKAPKL